MKINSQCGFSVIELMVASTLGIILLIEFSQVYLSVRRTFLLQHAFAQIQENGRFAVYILNQNIRQAGLSRCVGSQNPNIAVVGYSSETKPSYLQNNPIVSNTDIIVITKCVELNETNQLLKIAFFIATTTRKNLANKPINALYMKLIPNNQTSSPAQELVQGIDNMQISYGISENNIINYRKANAVTAWNNVKSVQIKLLLNSIEAVLTKPESYYFNNQKFSPNDRMLHKEWDTYIALRNVA